MDFGISNINHEKLLELKDNKPNTNYYSLKDFFLDFVTGGFAGMAMLVSYFPLE